MSCGRNHKMLVVIRCIALYQGRVSVAVRLGQHHTYTCASGCVVECRICNREVAGSNLGLGYFAPRSTQPSIPPGSVNEYQLRLGRQRQVWFSPIADERVGVHVKL